MSEQPRPVRGPLYVEATPLMVTLDASPLVSNNTHDVLNLLLNDANLFDAFMELVPEEPHGIHDGHVPDRLDFEGLHARLVERLSTKVALSGPQAVRVGKRLVEYGEERSIPEQRGEAA